MVAVGCLFSTNILNKIGAIKCQAYGSLFNVPWILSYIFACIKGQDGDDDNDSFYVSKPFVYFIIITCSICNGFGQGVMWVGNGKYMSDCATEQSKGFFFSYFWAFYMSSQVFGNLIASFVLGAFHPMYFFMLMAFISLLASLSFFLLKEPIPSFRAA